MAIDFAALVSPASGFIIFLVAHILILRSAKVISAPKVIMVSFIFGCFATAILHWIFLFVILSSHHFSTPVFFVSLTASSLIYLLLVFHYIAWVFGMGEAAIRIRLLCEIACANDGLTLDRLFKNYNADKILEVRLKRLINAGHLKFDGTFYELGGRILLLQIAVVRFLKYLFGIRP